MRASFLLYLWVLLPVCVATAQPVAPQPAPESVFGAAGDPRAAAPTGAQSSLGGSGATGADSVGILPERDTGFDRKIWRDTPLALVLKLVDRLPGRIDSAAEHELAKNLLVSVADAPKGDDGGDRLLLARVRKLLAIGNVNEAAALARAQPGVPDDPALARAEIDAELLADQIEAACIDLRAFAAILTDPVSANALLLCRQRAGEAISVDVPPMDVDSLGAAARIAGAPLPAAADSPPARLAAAAHDPRLAPEQRLEAAFEAGRASAMYGDDLATVFRAAPPAAGVAADAGATAGAADAAPSDGAAAAALFHAIETDGDTHRKLALAERGLLSPEGVADKISVAMAQPLRDLQPVPELGVIAARMAIVFYTLGDTEAATPWAELAEQSGAGAAVWPYRVLLKQADPLGIADWEQQSGLDDAHLARVLMTLSAFGVTAPPGASRHIAGEDRPDPAMPDLLAIDRSAGDLRVGETTLRAIAMLGQDGPARAHPLALRRALADLDGVQMHNEARALAFEAITAALATAPKPAPPEAEATSGDAARP
jgi:hypothetical protein